MPKVSVLTPIYKTKPEYLRQCIDSVLNQTFRDFEFLIYNDSPDAEYLDDIVNSYSDTRIKYIKGDKNIGISAARNKLLELSTGQYLAIFDHDDISLPHRLEKQVEYLDANSDVGVCGCRTLWFPKPEYQRYPIDNLSIKCKLMYWCCVPHSGAMIRKSVMTENNIHWESEFSPAEDYMLWIRLLEKTMFHNIPDVLLHYRMFSGNTTHRLHDRMVDRDAMVRNIAHRQYPYLVHPDRHQTVRLFFFIPLLRIKPSKRNHLKCYLFGFIPLFSIKRRGQ